MGKTRAVFPLAIFVPLILAIPAVAQHEHGAGEPEKLGKVEFAISCDPALQPQFNRAVALQHSFWYQKAAEADPAWGKPLFKLGLVALNKGDKDGTVKAMEKVIVADPNSPEAAQAKAVIEQLKKS